MKCDSCHEPTYNVSILGIMPWDRAEGREPASMCSNCTDTCPCGSKGFWMNGHLTCKHGFVYKLDYRWVTGHYREVSEKAEPIFNLIKRTWWSYFIVSNSEHAKSTTNAI